MINYIHQGQVIEGLNMFPDKFFHTCVTSPPYFQLRDYGVEGQIGLEKTPEEYIQKLVEVFRVVRNKLRDDGTLWVNIGDSFASKRCGHMKPKDLMGMPWRVAFALQADGWYLRQDIIWCLSGGTNVYARTQKGDMPMTIKDLYRLNPETVKLWNGKTWTQLLGISKSKRRSDEIELVLRSGERISCTPTHKFPTDKGLLEASKIKIGTKLKSVHLPEPETPLRPNHISTDAMWFIGLYLAEGSMSEDTIQIAGHVKETYRLRRLEKIAADYGGYITKTISENKMDIRLYGKVLVSIINQFIYGRTAKNKCLNTVLWRYSNDHLLELLNGYLSGDGHHDAKNDRWRLGFTRNYNLERDMRVLCARLGFKLTLNMSTSKIGQKTYPSFRGEIRERRSGHFNEKDMCEVVEIRKARCREVYDLGVEDEPHLFALASGILTHNSKPNPMPESAKDRCTKAHEYIFLLSKSHKYYFDNEAIKQDAVQDEIANTFRGGSYTGGNIDNSEGNKRKVRGNIKVPSGWDTGKGSHGTFHREGRSADAEYKPWETLKANKRSVWTVATEATPEAHFATFPQDLIVDCIKAGSPEGGNVLDPFMGSGTTAIVAKKLLRNYGGCELNPEYMKIINKRMHKELGLFNQ